MPEQIDAIAEQVIEPDPIAAPRAIALAPSNFIFTGEDALRLTVHNSQSGVVVAVNYRQHTPDGTIHASADFHTPTTDRLASTREFEIGRGALLNVTVYASSGSPRRGQTFVRLQVIRGRGAAAIVLGTIVQGYVTGNQDRAWPGSPLEGSLDGDGYYRSIIGTDPAASANISETVPAGARWMLVSIDAVLVTTATAGSRYAELRLIRAGVNAGGSDHFTTEGPNGGDRWTWQLDAWITSAAAADRHFAGMPGQAILLAGEEVRVTVKNMQAGDDWQAPVLTVREWLEAA